MSSKSSHSRRSSSQASTSSRGPKWKTPASLAATSVSRVFAQPHQSSPLRSAIDQLPALQALGDSQSIYSDEDARSKRGSAASIASVSQNTLAEESASRKTSRAPSIMSKGEDDVPAAQDPDTPTPLAQTLNDQQARPMDALPANNPEETVILSPNTLSPPSLMPLDLHTNPSPQPAPSLPQSSSWFSSLSRGRGRPSISVSPASSPQSPSALTAQPSGNLVEAVAESLQTSPAPKSSPEYPAASSSPPTVCPSSPKMPLSAVSSLDDEVPALKSVPPEAEAALKKTVETSKVVGRKTSATAMNPSASRFMIRIPLLGRPKTPLEEAITHVEEEVVKSPEISVEKPQVPEVVVSEPSNDDIANQEQPSGTAPFTEAATAEPAAHKSDDGLTSPPTKTPDLLPSSSSWWSYVGWSSPTLVSEASEDENNPELSTVAGQDESTEHLPTTSDQTVAVSAQDFAESTHPSPEPLCPPSPARKENSVPEAASGEVHSQQTPSLRSAETSKSQGSAWYSPWNWYAASPITPSSSTALADASKAQSPEDSNSTDHQKTASEMVKEEALARDTEDVDADRTPRANNAEVPTAGITENQQDTTPKASPSLPSNPIESSISSNRSGWASFFMSKALLVKNITDGSEVKRDGNNMEVMVIDDEDDQDAKDTAATLPVPIPQQPSKDIISSGSAPHSMTLLSGKPCSKPSPAQSASTSPRVQGRAKSLTREREPRKSGPPAPPLTNSDSIKKETAKVTTSETRSPSPTPSKSSVSSPRTSPPNLVLPTWVDTFHTLPRSYVPSPPTPPPTHKGKIGQTLDFFSGVLFSGHDETEIKKDTINSKGKERERVNPFAHFGMELPKALDIVEQVFDPAILNEKCRVVVIGVAGWSPGAVTRTLAGGLPSTSSKFVDMTCVALESFEEEHGFKFKKVTKIPLEGDGTIDRKVAKVHSHLFSSQEWIDDLQAADVIFVAAHSQGCIVATHLIDRLIRDGHILTARSVDIMASAAAQLAPGGIPSLAPSETRTQKICCLSLCGIHLGPLRYLKTSSLLQPYIQYFENAAARELFEFQDTETEVSKNYVKALKTVMDHGAKMVYVASLNDQVVPIYSGLFTAASHPRILRALYIDGDAYHSSDFLSNLLVLLIRIMNSSLSDSGLLAHLSEATAGTLSGVGHSTAYEELASYTLAVNYLFLTTDGAGADKDLVVEPFNAVNEQNDYEIPWSLRDLIADERVAHFFAPEFSQLRDAFDHWAPKTSILRDVKRKLQPIQRLSSIRGSSLGSRL